MLYRRDLINMESPLILLRYDEQSRVRHDMAFMTKLDAMRRLPITFSSLFRFHIGNSGAQLFQLYST